MGEILKIITEGKNSLNEWWPFNLRWHSYGENLIKYLVYSISTGVLGICEYIFHDL